MKISCLVLVLCCSTFAHASVQKEICREVLDRALDAIDLGKEEVFRSLLSKNDNQYAHSLFTDSKDLLRIFHPVNVRFKSESEEERSCEYEFYNNKGLILGNSKIILKRTAWIESFAIGLDRK